MYEQEKITPYGDGREKAGQVEQMFDDIAPTYDTLNHRLSWNIDKSWRKKAIRALAEFHPQRMLDIATGTGEELKKMVVEDTSTITLEEVFLTLTGKKLRDY